MAHYRENIEDIELMSKGIVRSNAGILLGEADVSANRFGVRVFMNHVPVSLTGVSVIGYFVRADRKTVVINGGTVTGNEAYVTLPQACYAIEGRFTLCIKLSGGGVTGTMRIIDGAVVDTSTGTTIDPGTVVPDLTDLLAEINRMEEAVLNAEAAQAIITGTYDPPYAAGEYTIHSGALFKANVAIASAEAWTASHWKQVTVGGELSQLNQAIDDINDILRVPESIHLEIGQVMAGTGALYDNNTNTRTNKSLYLHVGDKILVDDSLTWNWARYTSDVANTSNFIAGSGGYKFHDITIATDGWYRFSFRFAGDSTIDLRDRIAEIEGLLTLVLVDDPSKDGLIYKVQNLEESKQDNIIAGYGIEIASDRKTISSVGIETAVNVVKQDKIVEVERSSSVMLPGYIKADGSYQSATNTGYINEILTVNPGDIVTVYGYKQSISDPNKKIIYEKNLRTVCAYSGETIIPDSGTNTQAASYTVPAGIDGIKVSITYYSNAYPNNVVAITTPDGITKNILRQRKNGDPLRWNGEMTSGDVVSLGFENAVTNKVWIFTGLLDGSFDTIRVGEYSEANNEIKRPYIEVTSTQVNFKARLEVNDRVFTHGLTIANDLQIIVEKGMSGNVKTLIVQSNGQRWKCDTEPKMGDMYRGVGCSSTCDFANATLTGSIKGLDKPVWVFGDSWVSLNSSRWVGQMIELGYDNGWLLNGHPGEDSEDAFKAFETLMSICQPKTIVWALGMNDADLSDTEINTSWLEYAEKVADVCDAYDVELILCTIPSVPASQGTYSGEARNMNAKNDWIRESGRRFVDVESAVGADRSGNWIVGYWAGDTDHTHPSEAGARAIMTQFLADVPEMLNAFTMPYVSSADDETE